MPTNPDAPPSWPGYAVAAAQAGASIYNTYQQGEMNEDQLRHAWEMYYRQREDNLAQWHLQNDYNSPAAQMKRFQEAGLNPNLIYGQGNSGNSSPIPSVSGQSYNPKAPQIDLQGPIATYFDTRLKTAQYDNLRAQNTVLIQDAALKAANTSKTLSQEAKTEFDLKQADRLKDISADTAAANLFKMQIEGQLVQKESDRRDTYANIALRESAEKILSMKMDRQKAAQEVAKLEKENALLEFDRVLKSQGLNPSDPTYMRVLTQMLNQVLGGTPIDFVKKMFK